MEKFRLFSECFWPQNSPTLSMMVCFAELGTPLNFEEKKLVLSVSPFVASSSDHRGMPASSRDLSGAPHFLISLISRIASLH